ncbi:CLUMA_CG002531, isoform A [Clunio marinus]|uniref:CLUMA_CG002531, isoform A n=1 Tax=Clunio marinus TaxID=568069 RepID=A0A1J1HNJ1_9DIPT|nr:CLUMA_CG002531, isoform A [Clunio marinus]
MRKERWLGIFALAFIITITTKECFGQSESLLRVGKSINVFIRYGYLSISMKVISYNDTERWIFKEPTRNIFQGLSVLETAENNPKGGFMGDFHMEFCDNKQQLFQAYFREFQIEDMASPWKAFTDGWHAEITAKKLGINSSYIIGDYSYVLVRVSRFRERARLQRPIPPNQLIDPSVAAKINNVTDGDTVSVLEFMKKFGTHYINSYVTGNSLYQVFVFNKRNYGHIKERLKSRGVLSLSKSDLYNFFAPWFAEHLGSVRCSSGNSTVERWAQRKLKLSYYLFTYNSLLKLHGSSSLLKALDELLGNEAILQLELKSLKVAFKDPDKRKWYEIVLDNTIKLWEVNMS